MGGGAGAAADAGVRDAEGPTGGGDGALAGAADDGPVWVPVSAPPEPVGPTLSAVPNPFNGRVALRLDGMADGPVTMTVHDAAGRMVRRLEVVSTGNGRTATWDGRDGRGRVLPSGAYFARARQGGLVLTQRLTYLK